MIFFSKLAEVHQELAIGIIHSGTGNDCRNEWKAVKDFGGIIIAGESGIATYDGMPVNAINAVVDFILPPGENPNQLLN